MYFAEAIRKMGEMSFLIGESLDGCLVCASMDNTPHLLVSGVTGSGKSVFMHSLLLSLMLRNKSENLRLVLCDSKIVEFSQYQGVQHLLFPVTSSPKMIMNILFWARREINLRLVKFTESRKRSLQGYNDFLWENFLSETGLPRIVIVVDDICSVVEKEPDIFEHISKIILGGRTVGIHLLLVTQNPVQKKMREITRLIPSKTVFLTLTERESRFLIASSAACHQSLPGNAIFSIAPGNNLPIKVIVAENEISESVLSISKKNGAHYDNDAIRFIESLSIPYNQAGSFSELDELIPKAVDAILDSEQASVSLLQRKLKLGYIDAARLMDRIADQGIVSSFDGVSPRRILISKEQWNMFNGKE